MNTEDGLSYSFSKPAGHIHKILKAFKAKDVVYDKYVTKVTTWTTIGLLFWFCLVMFVFVSAPYLRWPLIWLNGIGFLAMNLFFIFARIKSSSPGKKATMVPGIIFGIFATIFVTIISQGKIWSIPIIKGAPLVEYVKLFVAGMFIPGVIASISFRRRLRSTDLQDFELSYIIKILKPLLEDLPQQTKCRVSFNPFPPMWSQSNLNDWDADNILSFAIKPEPNSLLTIFVGHRQKTKHNRRGNKIKGYRHRLSYQINYKNDVLTGATPEQRSQMQKVMEDYYSQLKKRPRKDKAYRDLSNSTNFKVKVGEKAIGVSIATKSKTWNKTLVSDLMIHPASILELVKATTETMSRLNTLPTPTEP